VCKKIATCSVQNRKNVRSWSLRPLKKKPDRSGKSVAREPFDPPVVDRPIDNHGQSRHFPPFYNISTCFNVTKTVSSKTRQLSRSGRRSAGRAAGVRRRSYHPSASHVHGHGAPPPRRPLPPEPATAWIEPAPASASCTTAASAS
jgi:hypothetical protein